MNSRESLSTPLTAATVAGLAGTSLALAQSGSLDDFIARVKSPEDQVRGPAWQSAETWGAAAARPLATLMADPNPEVGRAAKRALWRIVRHGGRPGGDGEVRALRRELVALLTKQPPLVRREVLWMLSEVGTDDEVSAMAALLSDPEAREDARCALLRVPGKRCTAALRAAFSAAPEEFKHALADALRERGVTVADYPSRKLVPNRPTSLPAPPPS